MKNKIEYVMAIGMLAIIAFTAVFMNCNIEFVEASKQKKQKKENSKYTVVIDAGHGGFDPGKIGVNKELEKDINLKIALKLKKYLEENNINVVMTRTSDMGLYQETDKRKKVADMKKRVEIVNDAKPTLCISIHQNSYTSKNVRGAQTFYYSKSEEGKKLAEMVQSKLVEKIDPTNKRKAKSNTNYYLILNVNCPAIIVECGFLSNWDDAINLKDDYYQDKLAATLYEAISEYLSNI